MLLPFPYTQVTLRTCLAINHLSGLLCCIGNVNKYVRFEQKLLSNRHPCSGHCILKYQCIINICSTLSRSDMSYKSKCLVNMCTKSSSNMPYTLKMIMLIIFVLLHYMHIIQICHKTLMPMQTEMCLQWDRSSVYTVLLISNSLCIVAGRLT